MIVSDVRTNASGRVETTLCSYFFMTGAGSARTVRQTSLPETRRQLDRAKLLLTMIATVCLLLGKYLCKAGVVA